MSQRMTQKTAVLEMLLTDGICTTFDAFMEVGCTRLPNLVRWLKDEGHFIDKIVVSKKNRFGNTTAFNIYYMSGAVRCPKCLRYALYNNECEYECMHCKHTMHEIVAKQLPTALRKAKEKKLKLEGGVATHHAVTTKPDPHQFEHGHDEHRRKHE